MAWIFALIMAALVVCILIIQRMQFVRSRQQEMLTRLRQTRMYASLRQMLIDMPHDHIERVDLRPDEVSVLMLDGQRERFRFDANGFDPLRPQMLALLTQAILTDVPEVQDRSYYTFQHFRSRTPGGDEIVTYAYILRPGRKDYLLRAMAGYRRG